MAKPYIDNLLEEFLSSTLPKQAKSLVVTQKNVGGLDRLKQGQFEYIVLREVLESAEDIQHTLEKTHSLLTTNGRLIIVFRNFLQPFFKGFISSLWSQQTSTQNWLSTDDIKAFLRLTDFDLISHQPLSILKTYIPFVSELSNKLLLHLFPFNHFSFLHFIIARKTPSHSQDTSVSIIVPAKNEEGNIDALFHGLPVLHSKQEVIFVVAKSTDHTREEINHCIRKYASQLPFTFVLLDQTGTGKAQAVWQGFNKAKHEVLMIYDSDLSVKPQELAKFYWALISGKGEFVNGSRLIYPLETNAMQFINILGNKFFSLVYSFILGQNIKDTLCGTKVLWRRHFKIMQKTYPDFLVHDPFGDFALLTGASKLNLKIIDLPIRYYARNYGSTNISRFRNAWQLMIYSIYAYRKLKLRI